MKPFIGITMGDAAGIGPEVCLKAAYPGGMDFCRPVLIGDADVFGSAADMLGMKVKINVFRDFEDGSFHEGAVNVLHKGGIRLSVLKKGMPSAMCGAAAVDYFMSAVSLAAGGRLEGIATAPLSKKAVAMGGFRDTGHTEILSRFFRTEPVMAMVCDNLRVVLVSRHLPIIRVPGFVTANRIVDTVKTANNSRAQLGLRKARFAVLGLNPHSGEDGLLGREEGSKIIPALRMLEKLGIDADGPFPADGFFGSGGYKSYDFIVAMYHDQGLIPYKMQSFGRGVNLTLGIPIIRTSADHGTGYDIAWKGEAGEGSMAAAVKMASEMAERKRKKPANRDQG